MHLTSVNIRQFCPEAGCESVASNGADQAGHITIPYFMRERYGTTTSAANAGIRNNHFLVFFDPMSPELLT
jgi:hypothetical protein